MCFEIIGIIGGLSKVINWSLAFSFLYNADAISVPA